MRDHWRLLKAGKLPFLGRYGNWLSSGNQVWSSWTLTEPYALQRPWQGCVSNSKLCLNWFLFIIQLISLPQISHAIWLYPSPEYFFISRNTHISFHSDLGITGASSVGWCISLAGHAFTRCRLGQDLCDVGIRKSEVNTETRNPRCDILWKGCFNMF